MNDKAESAEANAPDTAPPPPSQAEQAAVTGTPTTGAATEPTAVIDEQVPGDRLGVPVGAAHRIWEPGGHKPSYIFLFGLSVASLAADIATKLWAERKIKGTNGIEVVKDHFGFIFAENRGGAWGLLQGTSENVRRPFFLLVSVAAIAFIMTLYRRLQARQRALRWGLPLVLGGALGNVFDRVRLGHVIDFIDVHLIYKGVDRHWPTFNVADIAICVGVGLMAIDMFTAKRMRGGVSSIVPPAQAGEPSPNWIPPQPIAPVIAAPALDVAPQDGASLATDAEVPLSSAPPGAADSTEATPKS